MMQEKEKKTADDSLTEPKCGGLQQTKEMLSHPKLFILHEVNPAGFYLQNVNRMSDHVTDTRFVIK